MTLVDLALEIGVNGLLVIFVFFRRLQHSFIVSLGEIQVLFIEFGVIGVGNDLGLPGPEFENRQNDEDNENVEDDNNSTESPDNV